MYVASDAYVTGRENMMHAWHIDVYERLLEVIFNVHKLFFLQFKPTSVLLVKHGSNEFIFLFGKDDMNHLCGNRLCLN